MAQFLTKNLIEDIHKIIFDFDGVFTNNNFLWTQRVRRVVLEQMVWLSKY